MKRLLLSLALLVAPIVAFGQSTSGITNVETGSLFLDQLTNVAIVPYAAYVQNTHKLGGGIMGVYNVTKNVGTGIGVEDIDGNISVLNANLQFKVETHPLTFLGWPAFTAIPWAGGFLGKSIGSGGSGGAAIGTGGGIYFNLVDLGKGWQIDGGGGAVNWSGAGKDFDGWHILGFLALTHGI